MTNYDFIDNAGEQVLGFVSAAKNLTKIGELTDKVTTIADSKAWREYTTAVGTDKWRACEFDYFLIACDLTWDDVAKIVAWSKNGAEIAPLMDRDAPRAKRRPLEEAAKTWHAAGAETLVERAARLGWTKGESSELRISPLPPRVRAKHAYGVTMDEHARETRIERVGKARRRTLDKLVATIRTELHDDLERLYVIDQLRRKGPGRPSGDHEQWARDVAELGRDTATLAKHWNVNRETAKKRLTRLGT